MATVALLPATSSDTIADRELGQTDLVHSTHSSFIRPRALSLTGDPRGGTGVAVDRGNGHIYVADHNNNRVLGWSGVSSFTNGADADIVIAPAPNNLVSPPTTGDFFTGGGGCFDYPTGLCGPFGLAVDPTTGNLLIADARSLTEVDAPFAQATPVILLSVANSKNYFDGTFDDFGVAVDSGGNVYVADRNQSEVVEYDSGSITPHLVFGQATSAGGACNKGGSPTADTLCSPYAVAVDGSDNLWVADTGNNRVLEYLQPLAALAGGAGDTTADLVIGQGGFTTNASGTTATTLKSPEGLTLDSHGNLFVGDAFNNRVTEYDAPITDGKSATMVIGQADATSSLCNKGGAVAADTLCNPTGLSTDSSAN